MEDDKNGGGTAVVRTPNSDTCGMIVNHGADGWAAAAGAAATLPPQAAAPANTAVFGVPIMHPAPPYGTLNNNNNNPVIKEQQQQLKPLKGPGNVEHRTKRPRRGKRKSKKVMPYMKDRMMVRYKAVAPNNTNQFLMEDHNDGPDIDKKISARYNNENGRTRNSSLTSLESDGEPIYSSSDEDGTSIQKEFIDTYRLVQEEQLAELSKNELTQRVIELEERVQLLESKRYKRNVMAYLNGTSKEDDEESIDPDPEEFRLMQLQVRELTTQNKLLQAEVETLKQVQTRTNNSDSSVDSESSSDSSDSSSSSSDGQDIEMKFLLRSSENDHAPKDN